LVRLLREGQIEFPPSLLRVVASLLVSAKFLASPYCWDVEIARAMERHKAWNAE
jgi:hypothetical protein